MVIDWLSLIIGAVLTSFGFLLGVIWDIIKFNRDTKQKDIAVLSALREELSTNINILKSNQDLLQNEISILDDNKSMVNPLNLLENGSWDFVKINPPKSLTKKTDALIKVRKVSQATTVTNEVIRSRESYRIHNGAMSNFGSRMRLYDQILIEQNENLIKMLEELHEYSHFV